MKRVTSIFSAVLFFITVINTSPSFGQTKKTSLENVPLVVPQQFEANMRKLCEDHIMWTRTMIICIVDDVPGKEQAEKRLLMNQVDIGNAIKPFYGNTAGKELIELLKSHVILAAEVIKQAKAQNTKELQTANNKWFANATEISQFLTKINPNWGLTEVKEMMYNHLKFTTEEANERINKNYDGEVMAYDKVQIGILEMSDMLTENIEKQFPDKFKKDSCNTASK